MKPTFWLLSAVLFALMPNFVLAQDFRPQFTVHFDTPDPATDPVVLAKVAERHEREMEAMGILVEAKGEMKKGDAVNAFSLLKQSVGLDPTNGEACMLLTYFYMQKAQPENIIATLNPIVNPPSYMSSSVGNEINTQMIYALALLDRHAWEDAVACYQKSRQCRRMTWFINGGGPERAWPNPKFSRDTPDYVGLRAYAHLVLGTNTPHYLDENDQTSFMLGHLQELLHINPVSFDAWFAGGCLLREAQRFDEARAAYASAALFGSPALQKEVSVELSKLNGKEAGIKRYKAQQAALQAKPR